MIPEASATSAALEAGLATHDWDMFEAKVGDVAEAVEVAIRAALEAAAPHMLRPVTDEALGYAVSAIRGHGEFTTAEAEAAVQDVINALGMPE